MEHKSISEEMIQRVAKAAASAAVIEAFFKIGLDIEDKETGKDITDLRSLIRAWREAKNVAFLEFVKLTVKIVMWGTLMFTAFKLGNSSGLFGGGSHGPG